MKTEEDNNNQELKLENQPEINNREVEAESEQDEIASGRIKPVPPASLMLTNQPGSFLLILLLSFFGTLLHSSQLEPEAGPFFLPLVLVFIWTVVARSMEAKPLLFLLGSILLCGVFYLFSWNLMPTIIYLTSYSTIAYLLARIINGNEKNYTIPDGIHQGCLISPFFF